MVQDSVLFDWDEANRFHLAEHGVSIDEAEYAVMHDPLDVEAQTQESEERFIQIGATRRGRILTIVTTLRGTLVRVVTAFDASRRRRMDYEQWRKEHDGPTS